MSGGTRDQERGLANSDETDPVSEEAALYRELLECLISDRFQLLDRHVTVRLVPEPASQQQQRRQESVSREAEKERERRDTPADRVARISRLLCLASRTSEERSRTTRSAGDEVEGGLRVQRVTREEERLAHTSD